jgi:hypothetical protein
VYRKGHILGVIEANPGKEGCPFFLERQVKDLIRLKLVGLWREVRDEN